MKSNTLRITASHWYDGQNSALYAYSSTGTVLPGLVGEIAHCLTLSKGRDYIELAQLYAAIAPSPTIPDLATAHEFWHRNLHNSDGSPLRCRTNGQLKTWKTRPSDFRLPVKYGLKNYFYLTPANIQHWVIAP